MPDNINIDQNWLLWLEPQEPTSPSRKPVNCNSHSAPLCVGSRLSCQKLLRSSCQRWCKEPHHLVIKCSWYWRADCCCSVAHTKVHIRFFGGVTISPNQNPYIWSGLLLSYYPQPQVWLKMNLQTEAHLCPITVCGIIDKLWRPSQRVVTLFCFIIVSIEKW